jgi:hypothetical protein
VEWSAVAHPRTN